MEDQQESYKGTKIILSRKKNRTQLSIGGEDIEFGQDAAGQFYLKPFAYARHDSLMEVARRYIDYRATVNKKSN